MRIVVLLSLWLLSACSAPHQRQAEESAVPAGFVPRRVVLHARPNVLAPTGTVTLHVPAKYDTLLSWLDVADTPMGDKLKYRFVGAAGCLLQESGYKRPGEYCQDTLDRLTIATQMSTGSEESLATLARRIQYWNEENKSQGLPPTVWKSQQVAKLHGRSFSIVESFGATNLIAQPYHQVRAFTVVEDDRRSWEVAFQFECKQADCTRLAQDAYQTLQSVRIDTAASRP